MKDAVLISIHRKWVEKIASGKKTIEVRKNFPRLKPPFKCYVYEPKKENGSGKVVMEFECDFDVVFFPGCEPEFAKKTFLGKSCLTMQEIIEYSLMEPLHGWKISRVKVYDNPKDVFDFGVKRPPQSWVYVYEVL